MSKSYSHESDISSGPPDLASYSDAYNPKIRTLLARIQKHAGQTTDAFVSRFYGALQHRSSTKLIIGRLHPEEFSHLCREQAEHLRFLISPDTTAESHFARAQHVGWIHAMIGVELPTLLEAYHLYQVEIKKMLSANSTHNLTAEEQQQLLHALQVRLMLDMESQIRSHAEVESATVEFASSLDRCVHKAGNLPDLLNALMRQLISLDGIIGCLFLRPDRHGILQTEAADETLGQRYADCMRRQRIPHINIHAETASGQGPGGEAWRSGQIQVNESYECDRYVQPWKEVAQQLGFRSSASVPLLEDSDQSFAQISLYSHWPGFFNSKIRQNLLKQIQQILSYAVLRLEHGTVIPEGQRREFRQHLAQGRVRLFYQPIIDLKSGRLQHAEALARLYSADESIIAPNQFLPAFGNADMLKLFEKGISLASRAMRQWQRDMQLQVTVSLNLPAESVIDHRYRDILFDAIQAGEIDASQLRLELLETTDPVDHSQRDARLEEFRRKGFALVQDDLGSGHSSLLRMNHIAFDEVKIDQGLVRSALTAPQRALEFIYYLTRLAHGFGVKVTVEGLENAGLIEAAAILGADHGQGYGIARPMMADDLASWHSQWCYEVDPQCPQTALGALAGHLLWDQQLASLYPWPDLIEQFIKMPSLVQRYISFKKLESTPLQSLVKRMVASALHGRDSITYTQLNAELMEELSAQWARRET